MSHYAVAVFSDDGDFDRLLAPYNENNRDEFEFVPVDYEEILKNFDEFRKQNEKFTLDMYIKVYRYFQRDGQWGYETNPHGYWDWHSLDGRDYMYDLKEDAKEDPDAEAYRKNDYYWYIRDPDAEMEAGQFWDEYVEKNNMDYDPLNLYSPEYYLKRYKTREQYVKEYTRVLPRAFITPDGEWHASGRVGSFGTSDEIAESAERYFQEWEAWIAGDANPYVNLVDCHV